LNSFLEIIRFMVSIFILLNELCGFIRSSSFASHLCVAVAFFASRLCAAEATAKLVAKAQALRRLYRRHELTEGKRRLGLIVKRL